MVTTEGVFAILVLRLHYRLVRLLAALMRNSPDFVRHWRLLTGSLSAARRFGPHMGHALVRTRGRYKIRVDLDDWLGQHVFATGDYEPSTSTVITKLVSRGDTVVDVGANIGYFSLLLAKAVGNSGRVFSFEPIPALQSRFDENIRLNRIQNVSLLRCAASDREGTSEFYLGPPTHLGVSSLRMISKANASIQVETMQLDDLKYENRRISFVKIDVEGAECAVLRGMQSILMRDQPDIVVEVIDSFLRQFGDSAAALYSTLALHGYRMYEITHAGLKFHPQWSIDCPQHFNALFTRRLKLPKALVTT